MDKNTKLILGVIILTILTLGGCVSQPTRRAVQEETIKIGATLALTGNLAYFGNNELRGFEQAVEDINAAGGINGKRLVLEVEDNKGDAKEAVTGVQKLIDIDEADVMISAFTHITNAVKGVILNKGRMYLYHSTVKSIAQESPYAFKDYFNAEDHARELVKVMNKQGVKSISYIGENSDQCMLFKGTVEEEVLKHDIDLLSQEVYDLGETSLKTSLLKLKLQEGSALVTCAWRHQHVLMKDMKEMGLMNSQIFAWIAPYLPPAKTQEMTDLFSENKAISTWYGFAEDSEDNKIKSFIQQYEKRYNEKPSPDAVYSYDDMTIIAEALKKCDDLGETTDRDCLSQQLLGLEIDGVAGSVSFDKDGNSQREVLFIQAVDGEWRALEN